VDALLIGLFLGIVLAFFLPPVQTVFRNSLKHRPKNIFAVPAVLSGIFLLFALSHGILSFPLAGTIAAYTLVPTVLIYINGRGDGRNTGLDLAVILALWLPLEFSFGQQLIPVRLQGTAHTLAYGVAITLALCLFLGFRDWKGLKYRLPTQKNDAVHPLLGLVIAAPILILVGRLLAFINPFHIPSGLSVLAVSKRFLTLFAGVALPEEILFRGLIQTWIMQRFGFHWKSLLAAAVVFGAAHLNNAPGGFPNWRYMIVATIAGLAFGKVFQESTTILSSAALHATINSIKYFFF
jgi:membrane protease YdiL (CAAX protease family)